MRFEKTNLKTLILSSLLFIGGALFGQESIRLKVQDAKTKSGIPSVNILNKSNNIATATNEEGFFSISGALQDSIKISNVGYQTIVETIASLKKKKSVSMRVASTLLAEATITGEQKRNVQNLDKLQMKSLEAPTVNNTVDAKILEQRNVTELGDAMKSVTGVRPINRYGGFQTFRIRGFNNFVMLVDGVRDERHNLSTSAPSTNLANVERIEVLKGPASVLFGHSALGGIINIVRKKPTNYQTGEFKVGYGSFNTYNMSAGIGGPVSKKLNYRADFGMTRSDGWRDYGVATNNGSLMLEYNPSDKDKIEIALQANKDKYDTGIPVDADGNVYENMDPETRYNDPQDYLYHTRVDGQVKYTRTINNNLKITNHLSYSDDDIDYLSTEFWLYMEYCG